MKLFISADLEGVTSILNWKEASNTPPQESKEAMTKEVLAACKGAISAGAKEIFIKDAHGEGKNIIHSMLPQSVKVSSGWGNHPYNMVEGLDDTFDGILFIGYHSCAMSNTSPLAHTLDPTKIKAMYLNDELASEFIIHAYIARMLGVPIIAVSGDGGLIREVEAFDSHIETVATKEGFGGSIISIHPKLAEKRITKAIEVGIEKFKNGEIPAKPAYPQVFNLKVVFKKHEDAYKASFYPEARQIDEFTVSLTSDHYEDILKYLLFI